MNVAAKGTRPRTCRSLIALQKLPKSPQETMRFFAARAQHENCRDRINFGAVVRREEQPFAPGAARFHLAMSETRTFWIFTHAAIADSEKCRLYGTFLAAARRKPPKPRFNPSRCAAVERKNEGQATARYRSMHRITAICMISLRVARHRSCLFSEFLRVSNSSSHSARHLCFSASGAQDPSILLAMNPRTSSSVAPNSFTITT
ncbi:hypothetical protein PhaeoP30_03851 (plasmid) [Phaeobacter inhibens]|nr:hypothetical protein PhaeoP30_03851 [Phaeobacter inhibens]